MPITCEKNSLLLFICIFKECQNLYGCILNSNIKCLLIFKTDQSSGLNNVFLYFKVYRRKDGYVAIKDRDGIYSFTRVPPAKRVRDTSFKYGGQVRKLHLVNVYCAPYSYSSHHQNTFNVFFISLVPCLLSDNFCSVCFHF